MPKSSTNRRHGIHLCELQENILSMLANKVLHFQSSVRSVASSPLISSANALSGPVASDLWNPCTILCVGYRKWNEWGTYQAARPILLRFRDIFADKKKSCLNHLWALSLLVLGFELELDQLVIGVDERTGECGHGLAKGSCHRRVTTNAGVSFRPAWLASVNDALSSLKQSHSNTVLFVHHDTV